MNGLDVLRNKYRFPDEKPDVPGKYENGMPAGWCAGPNRQMFRELCNKETKVIIDGGSWMGLSAWWELHCAPNATVLCIDHWKGSREHRKMQDTLAVLWDTFCVNLWDFRDRIIPMKTDSVAGMQEVYDLGLKPDIVYIDWSHDPDSVFRDVSTALKLFPDAEIIGDDLVWSSVRTGLDRIRDAFPIRIEERHVAWRIVRQ